jgi:hypothetical protein
MVAPYEEQAVVETGSYDYDIQDCMLILTKSIMLR